MTLTSRPTTLAPYEKLDPPDLTALITTSGIKVCITIDESIDPPELRVVQEAVWPYPKEVLLHKAVGDGISLYDLIKVIDVLGYPVDYQEIK